MASAETDRRIAGRPRGSLRAWLGVFVPPGAWAAQLVASWALGEVIACAPANRTIGTLFGVHVNAVAAAMNAALLAISVLAGIGSFAEWRARRAEHDPTPEQRATWLALAGVISSILFSLGIVMSFLPIGLVNRCFGP
jgi:hypothetical protein